MNYSVLAVVLLSLGSVLATPAFLKDADMCEELGCCATTTTTTMPTTTTTGSGDGSTITTEANAPTAFKTEAPTTTMPPTTTTTAGPTTTTVAPTCETLNCNCGDDGESS